MLNINTFQFKPASIEKTTGSSILATIFFWMIVCQLVFYFVQKNQSLETGKLIGNEFREELKASNFSYLSRAISDMVQSGSIQCPYLTRIEDKGIREILDLRYFVQCSKPLAEYLLDGASVNQELKAINGDVYRLTFRTVNSEMFIFALWILRISGILIILLGSLLYQYKSKQSALILRAEKEISSAKILIGRQVAHDIRSPLSAISLVLPRFGEQSFEEVELVRSAINRVNEIVSDLLRMSEDESSKENFNFSNGNVSSGVVKSEVESAEIISLVVEIIEEKKLLLKSHTPKIILVSDFDTEAKVHAQIASKSLRRILSNLINNAIEAIERSEGLITISIRDYAREALITISDNGKGIKEEILSNIGNVGFSFGKEGNKFGSGSGLGINHAKTVLENVAGKLNIRSKADIGTIIEIVLKK